MKVLKNLFGNNTKINAKEIVYKDGNDNIKTLDEHLNKNIMTITYTPHNFTSTAQWKDFKVEQGSITSSIGNKLTFENNEVQIGEGISHVLVSGTVNHGGAFRLSDYVLKIIRKRNETTEEMGRSYENGEHYYFSNNISPILIEVNKGDSIYLAVSYSMSGSNTVEILESFMTVESIN